ncbi:MAG: bifunctional DNA primase/polymerase, partial [Gemmataceae bacterium]|nr:bifunctional DNA primase/polymerase [Gemmataceae bacterium]
MAITPSVAGPERLYAAINYAEKHNFRIIPDHTIVDGCCTCGNKHCDRPGKHPMTKNGVKDATDDLVVITNWWAETGNLPNVGIATGAGSMIVVVDIDVKGGGLETLALWKQEHADFPNTPTVKTPTGGLHLYFKYTPGVGSKTGIAPGIDIRGDGGQVVAPPSIHANGGLYEWLISLLHPLAELPEWLLDLILNPKPKDKPKSDPPAPTPANPMVMTLSVGAPDLRTNPGAGEGQRHDTLCRLAGVQLARGDREVRVLEDALAWAETCKPPMEMKEVIRTVKSLAAKHDATTPPTSTTVMPTIPATVADEVDDAKLPDAPPWPVLGDVARHGIVGDYLRAIADSTEADPAGILISKLVAGGNCVGRGPRFQVEGDYHHANENAVTVGQSAKGRKGTGLGRSTTLYQSADAEWHGNQIASGMSSGEGVIWLVRDPIERIVPVKDKKTGAVTGHQTVVEDPGVTDKRFLIIETEFAQALRSMRREGNTLSAIIRQAWDRGVLRSITKNSPAKATDAHISILGHISMQELQKCLGDVELFNGFANRFLWALVKRHQLLPEGGEAVELGAMAARMSEVLTAA